MSCEKCRVMIGPWEATTNPSDALIEWIDWFATKTGKQPKHPERTCKCET